MSRRQRRPHPRKANGNYQYERRRPGEMDATPQENREVDRAVSSNSPRPRTSPTSRQTRDAYRSQRNRLLEEALSESERNQIRRDTRNIRFQPTDEYYSTSQWLSVRGNLTCCPPAWDYGCASQSMPLSCSANAYGTVRGGQWCCPFWPSLNISKCKCNRCVILKPKCAKEGRCYKRLTLKKFYAICYSNGRWSYIRYITRYLPTSCYCRARN